MKIEPVSSNYKKWTSRNPIQQFLIRKFADKTLEIVQKMQPENILDIGCGEGFLTKKLASLDGCNIVGMDISYSALEFAIRQEPSTSLFVCADICNIPVPQNGFDVVLAMEVLEHSSNPERAVSELLRVANRCLISVPCEPFYCGMNFLRGKNIMRLGSDIDHVNKWTFSGFENFWAGKAEVKFHTVSLPWQIVVVSKLGDEYNNSHRFF